MFFIDFEFRFAIVFIDARNIYPESVLHTRQRGFFVPVTFSELWADESIREDGCTTFGVLRTSAHPLHVTREKTYRKE